MDVKIGHVLFDLQRELLLGHVGGVETAIVGTPNHLAGVLDTMEKTVGYVADMDEVALEMFLEQNDVTIRHRRVREVVHKQIETHPWRSTKHGGKPQGNCVGAV